MMGALLLALLAASPVPDAVPRRFAVVVGNNQGLGGDATLRYAERDARSVLTVLEEVGGVRREDSLLLLGADADTVRGELVRFEKRLQEQVRPGDQLFVYISSHAEGDALRFSGTRLPMREVTRFVEQAPVGVALLVVDACESGRAVRLKGLKPLPGILMSVEQPAIAGRVIITASAADEAAQESDALAGSVFTHHLIAALRGAADLSGDGRVTLSEAYSYSYARTVESSLLSRAGVQHPSFRVDLEGHGELILTSPAAATSLLTLAIDEPGDWTVSTLSGEPFLGHVRKGEGAATLALPAGGYILTTRQAHNALEARVQVPASGRAQLTRAQLVPRELVANERKGSAAGRWMLHLGPAVGLPLVSTFGTMVGGSGQLQYAWEEGVVNVTTAALGLKHGEHVAGDLQQNDFELRLGVGHLARDEYGIGFQLTAEFGGVLAWQWQPSTGSTRFGLHPYAGIAGGMWIPLGSTFRLTFLGNFGPAWVRKDSGSGLVWTYGGGVGIGVVR
ncbi:caspase family protein [Archangium violaceum]|uniref:caspase family protein n=1 Tax=Archangium violaceum TaxID=83451 RepID=UPI002B2B2759|nr:caspase family protein [Archangium gephyra]